MAAIQVSKAPHVRTRSTSDPFSDPVYTPQHRIAQVPRSTQTPTKQQVTSPLKPTTDPRAKVHRSQTSTKPGQDMLAPPTTRSISQDSVVRAATHLEKNKNAGRRTGKKGSMHADVIDRLDFSGVGPMFHHDGPFDACAPSRNRRTDKAPMLSWGAGSAAKDDQALARARKTEPQQTPRGEPNAYASPVIPYEAPKKSHDALAEAWGIHEPEPFEEFSAGGGIGGHSRQSTRGSTPVATQYAGSTTPTSRRSRENAPSSGGGASAAAARQGRREKRTPLPPPQPIFVADNEHFVDAASDPESAPASPTSPHGPKRSRSLMHRIRNMRDNPNVPAGAAQEQSYESDTGAAEAERPQRPPRPTHRSQRSFLGRIGGAGGGAPAQVSTPRSPRADDTMSPASEKETFVYVEKQLPRDPAPRSPGEGGHFDESYNGVAGASGLGRKTSLMKRAKGLMRGGK